MVLAEGAEIEILRSFISRRSTFKDKLLLRLGNAMDCVQPLEKSPSERQSLLIPTKFANVALSKLANERTDTDDLLTMPRYEPQEDIFLSLVRAAMKIRRDLMEEPGLRSLSVSEQDAIDCVPDSLHMFLQLLFGGQKLLHGETVEEKEAEARCKVLSSAQDIVYGVSGGTKWTPKHVGLGSTLHQVTRLKDLLELFNKAGHILNYDQILQVDTSLAENVLKSLDPETGSVMPPNLLPGKFVHFSADNIDIVDETMDGKNTFHATQIAAWQRGAESNSTLENLKPSTKHSLSVPESMEKIYPVAVKQSSPMFLREVRKEWFDDVDDGKDSARTAQATDMAFNMLRHKLVIRSG